jgi:predicted dehydrogenase
MRRTAIIGLGIMGRRMLEHMAHHPRFDPVLLWDPDPEACTVAKQMAPQARITATAEEAIEAADCVYLACPPLPRAAYARRAAHLGKPLFLEKPLGVDVIESRRLADDLEAAGVPVAINFTQAAGDALARVIAARDSGALGAPAGVDIIVTYPQWPRQWQVAADWLRFRAEGGFTREVISHFIFFTERVIGPTRVVWARPSYPADPALCETHLLARLENAEGVPVTVLGSVGGAQPDRQEVTVKGTAQSHRISEFSYHAVSDGGPFVQTHGEFEDRRVVALKAQLDGLDAMVRGEAHPLATLREALGVQECVETMLAGTG